MQLVPKILYSELWIFLNDIQSVPMCNSCRVDSNVFIVHWSLFFFSIIFFFFYLFLLFLFFYLVCWLRNSMWSHKKKEFILFLLKLIIKKKNKGQFKINNIINGIAFLYTYTLWIIACFFCIWIISLIEEKWVLYAH